MIRGSVPPLSLPVQFCALVVLVAFIFMIGGIVRKRWDVVLIAILVMLIAVVVAAALGFAPLPLPVPSPIG